MKWHAQVVHVARKDLRMAGWLILAYVAVVVGATASTTEWVVIPGTASPLWMFVLVLLGMNILVSLVQADSPARSDAFWATRPLYPLAVFGAKIAVALLLLLGLALLGQLVALLAHDVAAPDLPGLLAESALSYGRWLGVAAVIAALTRDLRTFLVVLVVGTIAWGMGTGIIASRMGPREAPGSSLILNIAAVVSMLLVLAHQYVTRNVRWGVSIAGLLAFASMLYPLAGSRASSASQEVPNHLRLTGIRMEEVRFQQMTGGGTQARLRLRLQGASKFHRYALISPAVRLHLPNGSTEDISMDQPFVPPGTPTLPFTEEFQWLGAHNSPGDSLFTLSIDLSESQREALSRSGTRLVLRGAVEVQEPRVLPLLRLHPGVVAARRGERVRVEGVERTAEDPSVKVRLSSVSSSRSPDSRRPGLFWAEPFTYALLNPQRREALALTRGASSGSDLALVLPGPRTSTETTELRPVQRYPKTSLAQVGEEWLTQARLLIVRWAPVGSYPVTIETQSPVVRAFAGSAGPRVRAAPRREPVAGQ